MPPSDINKIICNSAFNAKEAATTTTGLDAGLNSGNIHESPLRSHEAPLHEGHTSGNAKDRLQLKELIKNVPKLVTRIDDLEKELHQTKNTYGKAVLTLVERGRKIQDIDDDPLVSLLKESMKEKYIDFMTPTKVSASGEAQESEISPTILEAAKTLSQVASQTISTYKRRVRSTDKGKDINTGLDAEAEINTGSEDFNTGSIGVNTGSGPVSTPSVVQTINVTIPSPVKSQREGKAPMTTKDDEEAARQVHLDALLAKRISEEEELSLQQKKRKVEVLEAAQMVEMINQKKKYYAEQKAKARRSKHMTQAQQREYMSVQLEQESSKKQKTIEDVPEEKVKDVKEEEIEKSIKKRGKRRKQLARKGIHVDKTTQSGTVEREAYMKEKVTDPSLGQKAIYQIIRENGADKVYMSFGAILKDFSRDDLTELYRLVIKKYGANRPEEAYDRVLWGDLKTMFDPPLNRKYPLSKYACQAMLNMKLQGGAKDEVCYQLLKMIEKQAGIRWSGL
ncbi:hypothetical protein Tco_0415362 [Tanacetum coccineum]